MALMWLSDYGLVHKVHRVTVPNIPLKAYEDLKAFKLFLVDVGLLSWMVRLNQRVLLNRDVLECPINNLLDISGWDIKKSLKLLKK